MNKRGFTLIELLGVILIIFLLVIIVLPKITNSVNNFSAKTDKLMLQMIEDATLLYIEDNKNDFPKNSNNKYCVTIKQLVDEEYLKEHIEYQDVDITQIKSLQITYEDKYNIELVDRDLCVDYKNICRIVDGELNEIGSKYQCKVKNNMETGFEEGYYFYVLSHNNDGTTNLIMDRNICKDGFVTTEENICEIEWINQLDYELVGGKNWKDSLDTNHFGPVTAMNDLYNATKDWTNIPNIFIDYKDEWSSDGYGYGGISTTNSLTKIIKKDGSISTVLTNKKGYKNLKSRMPYLSEIGDSNGHNEYLYENLDSDTWDGKGSKPTNNINGIVGYWLSASFTHPDETNTAYIVMDNGFYHFENDTEGSSIGVRPVITVPKYYLTIQPN